MFFKIIKFEVLSRFKRPMFALLILLMAFQAIWVTQGSFEYFANDSNIRLSNVQGADMMKIALPEALDLILVEKQYGREGLDPLLDKKKKAYIKYRGNEPNKEPALIYADGVDYLEPNKGTLILFELSQKLRDDRFIERIVEWSTLNNNEKNMQFLSLYQFLIQDLDIEALAQIKTIFEEVK
ncbi:MAG: hypothetical protein AAGI25_08025 [Bacteroidota bacterium]